MIEVTDAIFGYGNRGVVEVRQLNLHAGRCLGIFGPNGSGKTTLVRGVSGLLAPLRGHVRRNPNLNIGYMPQYRAIDQSWPMSGLDAALLATSARQRLGWVGSRRNAALGMMRTLGVEALASRRFAKLSGGQQQRILLAGVMTAQPDVLLLDEPTDGLDVHSRQNLLDLLRKFTAEGLASVIISHEVEDLMYLCHQVARLHPADDPEHPAQTELISPDQFAQQLTAAPRAGAVL
jgi:ABC-type Mn2+/Zn2+ transport system ATPase subunit